MRIASPLAWITPLIAVSLNPVWSSLNAPPVSRIDPCACGLATVPASCIATVSEPET